MSAPGKSGPVFGLIWPLAKVAFRLRRDVRLWIQLKSSSDLWQSINCYLPGGPWPILPAHTIITGRATLDSNVDFLGTYAEVMLGFVAFTAITVTLRQSLSGRLTPIQYLLFRFFIEVGLLSVLYAVIPIGLIFMSFEEPVVWRLTTYWIIGTILLYFPFYLQRRRKTEAPVPFVTVLVMIGFAVDVIFLIITVTEILWQPSRIVIAAHFLWVLASLMAVFAMVLGSFVEIEQGAD